MVSKVKSHSMAGRGDFSKTVTFVLSRYIDIFCVWFVCWWENAHFFGCHCFFWFCKGMFQKTAKKMDTSKVNSGGFDST